MNFFENDLQFNTIIFRDRFYHPPEVNAAIHHMVDFLRGSIVSDTPFIYLFAPNHIKTVIAFFAIVKSGHVCVLVDPDIGRLELAEMKQDTPPCALIHIDRNSDVFDYKKEIVLTENNPREFDQDELEDVAIIMYTNAEDGYAKGAMLTRRNLLANAESGAEKDTLCDRKIICGIVPFHHMFGLQTGLLTPLSAQAIIVIEDITALEKIHSVLHSIFNHHVTNLYSIPLIYYLLPRIDKFQELISKLENICSGGCTLSESIASVFYAKSGKRIFEGYGLTECSPVCTFPGNGKHVPFGSVGTPLSCNRIRILRDERDTPPPESGEICISGKNVFKGYYRKPGTNDIVLKNGWFSTGDYGKIDTNGNLFITGRKKNMINIGSKKVYPALVARYLSLHGNVRNATILKVNHPILSESVHAQVELKEKGDRAEIAFKEWCHANLSNHTIPKRIIFS